MSTTTPKRIANHDVGSLSEAGEAARSHFREQADRKQAEAALNRERIASHDVGSLSEAGEAALKHLREEAERMETEPR